MNKEQAIHKLWSSFGITAYDENSVPDNAKMPYITYSVSADALDHPVILQANLWYHSTSWEDITKKKDEIARKIGEHGFYSVKLNDGYLWVVQGHPFAQRMDGGNDTTKRIFLNVTAEFLTAY